MASYCGLEVSTQVSSVFVAGSGGASGELNEGARWRTGESLRRLQSKMARPENPRRFGPAIRREWAQIRALDHFAADWLGKRRRRLGEFKAVGLGVPPPLAGGGPDYVYSSFELGACWGGASVAPRWSWRKKNVGKCPGWFS